MPPLVLRPDGSVEEMAPGRSGNALGVDVGTTYEAGRATIRPHEVVVLYSDGITDAMDAGNHQFGDGRLKQTLAGAPAGVVPVGEAILDAVRRHAAGRDQFDDMTLICLGRS
jgi:serine phosphatase RsbU (regulator of sigma subunit)